ncbi:MAG: chromate efflux transporter, partial [Noviherbaspirillum sp.]
ERRKLLPEADVLDGLSLASVLPGPTAINVIAYVGYRLRGAAGAAVCVCASVLPAFVFMILFSLAYFRWGQIPAVGKAFMGVVPAVAAIIMAAAWRMWRTSVMTLRECALAVGAATAMLGFAGIYVTLVVLGTAATAGYWWFGTPTQKNQALRTEQADRPSIARHPILRANVRLLLLAALPALFAPLPDFEPGPLLKLFGAFASMSMLMFGGGYVFIPLLQKSVVDGHGWVTRQEFIDALALGQVTPGPAMISATFIGYKVAGLAGAAAATIGMFAPTAVLAVLCARMLARIKGSVNVQAALRGVRAAAIGMVFAAAVSIGKSAEPHWISIALFATTSIMLLRYRVEAVWIVPAAGLIGFLFY